MVHLTPGVQGEVLNVTRPLFPKAGLKGFLDNFVAACRRAWLGLLLTSFCLGGLIGWSAYDGAPLDSRQTPLASPSPPSLAAFPGLVLWAWERPELLDFIDPHAVGVAFLARTLYLSGAEVRMRPRLQPLMVPPDTKLMAVVRIEVDGLRPPELSSQQGAAVVAAIVDGGQLPAIAALQVDFDAAVSQRVFYRTLLQELRRHLPASLPLSMTALASWCLYDDWLADLPVDEVVPMVFRMGADQQWVRRHLDTEDFLARRCRQSLGLATDEPLPAVRSRQRLYLFHPQPWRPEALTRILEETGRWPQHP
jgi:hypothetical protein